jgi:hypothetical protein
MNFQELMQRMAELDQPVQEEKLDVEEECGMGPGPMSMSSPGQQDSVNMSVNMSGSGSGGIKDLLDILRNLEKDDGMGDEMPIMIKSLGDGVEQEALANSPEETYGDVADVTATGDDLHSKGLEAPAANGGGNPMAMESLTTRLSNLYQEIKSR